MTSTNDIRRSFTDFFVSRGHQFLPSAPLVPQNDPTLMFVNAGMVPFKNIFTGVESHDYPRAVSSQKCVRAGGKHNDLDNVGHTARHHTFFEMLGNFSFGDYFKEEAIVNAWDLLTKEWALPAERLTATVYHNDDEAYTLWKKVTGLPNDRIIRIASNDNYWSMGDSGPCGPSSEIFYDHGDHIAGGPPGSPDEDGDRFVEIWNLVFMQYDQVDGRKVSLPKPSIDTGMGLERVAAVLQGRHDNYDTDLFRHLIDASRDAASHSLAMMSTKESEVSHRVIADHLRSCSFLLADGVLPTNEGRGYVLRRIMRRAMRHALLIGAKDPHLYRLVPALLEEMGGAYPELIRARQLIENTLLREETSFRKTLSRGLKLLDSETRHINEGGVLPGNVAFKLYDTYGFPIDLTNDALKSRGIRVDQDDFDQAMATQRKAARAAWKGSGEIREDGFWFDIVERDGPTEFTGHINDAQDAIITAIIQDGTEVEQIEAGQEALLLTNQTPFYAESGGQQGDRGWIYSGGKEIAMIRDTQKQVAQLHVHAISMTGEETLRKGDAVHLGIDVKRRNNLRANHSATHLLHRALRGIIGEHVTQRGSLVSPQRLRFDYSHGDPLSSQQLASIEDEVNAQIRGNIEVKTRLMAQAEAIEAGAIAIFGEKYGDEVRVLSMGDDACGKDYSVELCGGTHVHALGEIGLFTIISDSAVSSGVRRIEALTGEEARQWLNERARILTDLIDLVRAQPDTLVDRVSEILQQRKRLQRELDESKKALVLAGSVGTGKQAEGKVEEIAGVQFIGRELTGVNAKELRGLIDEYKQRLGSGVIMLTTVNDGRVALAIGVTDDLHVKVAAPDMIGDAVQAVGGKGGGGRPALAQGGGPNASGVCAAIDSVRRRIQSL